MPVAPHLRHLYRGPEWEATRKRILERADNKCEHCKAPNGKTVLRLYGWWTEANVVATVWAQKGRFLYEPGTDIERDGAVIVTRDTQQFIELPWKCAGQNGPVEQRFCTANSGQHRWVGIVLTIAHLNHTSGDDREENLAALCQWCHLNYDKVHHKHTRCARKDATRPLLQEAIAL